MHFSVVVLAAGHQRVQWHVCACITAGATARASLLLLSTASTQHSVFEPVAPWSLQQPAFLPQQYSVVLQTFSVAQKEYETVRHATFFREEACKKLYKDNVDYIVNRKNSYNGIMYKNDPTILAWNLINEPRCETWRPENSDCPGLVSSW